jgi:hypothetical protein
VNTEPEQSAPEEPRDWYFTFGANHTHPTTGQRLGRSYVRIHGTCEATMEAMFAAFGDRWSHQYPTTGAAGVERYALTEVELPTPLGLDSTPVDNSGDGVPEVEQEPFEEQVADHLQRLEAERSAPVEERTEEEVAAAGPLGYIVLIREPGYWADDWDGEVHETREQGDAALTAAREAHWDAVLAAAIRVDEEPSGGAAALRADVGARVLEEVAALRALLDIFLPAGSLASIQATAQLGRIEAAVREEEQR